MTNYQLHAQYPPAFDVYGIQVWHIARVGRTSGLCGQLLDPVAEVRPLCDYPSLSRAGRCRRCRNAYRALLARPASAPTSASPPVRVLRSGLVPVPVYGVALPKEAPGSARGHGTDREG